MTMCMVLLSSCMNISDDSEPISKTEYMLGTICTITVYDSESETAIDKAFSRIKEIENKMSVNKSGTEVDKVADASGKDFVKVSDDTFYVIKKGKYYSGKSGGVFDITIGPLVKLWGIGTDRARVPSQQEIDEKKSLINYKDIILDEKDKKVMLARSGMSLDLGGIAKGYSADEAVKILKNNGVKHAIVNLGGNILTINGNLDGKPWNIGIQNPFKARGSSVGTVGVTNKTVVTSGIYERYFEKDGKRYHHILNPFTGYPMDSDLASVTLVTDISIDADAMTKNIFYLGLNKGAEYVKNIPGLNAIFITKNKEIYVTEGLKNDFQITDSEFKLLHDIK
ncbi:FAD:protein FMN transferase [Clostridium luticellarii]|nr:FAD:protein FMN transferase [Clostridium luticellarii]MCI1944461.1 FAD:protein FMN transferase [Clostridium luticellarii]MCI1967960.1 FAD:protein FMN transferase [Clostridium luticellarii]MCI1995101.1 FAD:protein FMN transferase [Clostridium luticellarii]MCI2039260.1 FAD:protein FMN transferase [Clostridium luticellarii]